MPGSAVHAKARFALYATAPITDGDFAAGGATLLGPLADGADLPDPESQLDSYMGGQAEAGATISLNLRFLGKANLAAIQALKDANAPTAVYLYVTNHSLTAYTAYGPGNFTFAYEQGKSMEARRQSTRMGFYAEGDTAEDIIEGFDEAVTLPATSS